MSPFRYVGRDTHIHYKVRLGGSQGTVVLTGQLFVNDTISDEVNELSPYSSNTGANRVQLEEDNIYVGFGLIDFQKMDTAAGWAGGIIGTVVVPVSVGATSSPSGSGGPGIPAAPRAPASTGPNIPGAPRSSPVSPAPAASSSAPTSSSSAPTNSTVVVSSPSNAIASDASIVAVPAFGLLAYCAILYVFLVLFQ